MILKIVFWLLIAIDVAAVGLFLLLGLAGAGPSHTSALSVLAFFLIVPGLLLAASVFLFLMAKSPWLRGGAFLLAAAPLLFVVLGRTAAEGEMRQYQSEDGGFSMYRSGPMRDVEAAVHRNDAVAVKAALAQGADVNQKARDGSSVLVLALRDLQKHPGPPDVLRALLQAGAKPDPAATTLAISTTRERGQEPLRLLLDAGADGNALDSFGNPAYFMATGARIDPAVLQLLIDRGADLTLKSKSGSTALAQATLTQNWKAALLLLEKGADWKNVRTPMGQDFKTKVEADAHVYGDQPGLAEVLRFLKDAESR
jgi:hypothetical protein